ATLTWRCISLTPVPSSSAMFGKPELPGSAVSPGRVRPIISIWLVSPLSKSSAIARRRKGGTVLPPRASSILWRFRKHLAGRYTVVEITPTLLADAAKLANTHAPRAYDAVQLSAALSLNAQGIAIG